MTSSGGHASATSADFMPRVVALYRYPVKGFTPEPRESLTVLPEGRVAGDRVLAFRFADAPTGTPLPSGEGEGEGKGLRSAWIPKTNYAVLVNTPGLARTKLLFDEAARTLRIEFPDGRVVKAGLDPSAGSGRAGAGREKLAQAVAYYVIAQQESPLHGHPGKLPLQLVGNLEDQHFHDNAAGRVSLHSRASLRALGEALYDPELDERRFRSNIVIDGAQEWEELGWVGKRVRIGPPENGIRASGSERGISAAEQPLSAAKKPPLPPGEGWGEGRRTDRRGVEFEVVKTSTRCLATHANPVTGERDCDVLNTLTRAFGQERPTFAVSMTPVSGGGEVRVGDEVRVLGRA